MLKTNREDCATPKPADPPKAAVISEAPPAGVVPRDGFVPDSITAVRVAEAVAIAFYGREVIASERPLIAKLDGNTWSITGTLPPNNVGGVLELRMSRTDGRIVHLQHGL